jgi:hypothetical protein
VSRKVIAAVLLVAALVVTSLVGAAQAAGPYDQAPRVSIVGKAKLKKGKVKVAVATCGTGTCSITSKSARIKVGAAAFKGRFTGSASQPIAPGQSVAIKVKVPKRARALLAAGLKGKVKSSLTVTSSNRLSASASGRTKIKR